MDNGEQLELDFQGYDPEASDEDAPIIPSSDEIDTATDGYQSPLPNETFDEMVKRKQKIIWDRED